MISAITIARMGRKHGVEWLRNWEPSENYDWPAFCAAAKMEIGQAFDSWEAIGRYMHEHPEAWDNIIYHLQQDTL